MTLPVSLSLYPNAFADALGTLQRFTLWFSPAGAPVTSRDIVLPLTAIHLFFWRTSHFQGYIVLSLTAVNFSIPPAGEPRIPLLPRIPFCPSVRFGFLFSPAGAPVTSGDIVLSLAAVLGTQVEVGVHKHVTVRDRHANCGVGWGKVGLGRV